MDLAVYSCMPSFVHVHCLAFKRPDPRLRVGCDLLRNQKNRPLRREASQRRTPVLKKCSLMTRIQEHSMNWLTTASANGHANLPDHYTRSGKRAKLETWVYQCRIRLCIPKAHKWGAERFAVVTLWLTEVLERFKKVNSPPLSNGWRYDHSTKSPGETRSFARVTRLKG
jgi:hypothetical protein